MDKLMRLRVVACGFLVAACACGEESDGRSVDDGGVPVPPTVRDSAGIIIVENAEPQWATGTEWRIGELLTSIGEVQGDPSQELFRVTDATRQTDGTVAVGLSSSGEIRFFRQDGTFVRSVGTTGGGPGEFRGANALRDVRRVPGDSLLTWDLFGQTASIFDPEGEFVRSFQLDGPPQRHFFGGIFSDRSLFMLVYRPTGGESVESLPEGILRLEIDLHQYGADHRLANTHERILGSDQFQARWGPSGIMIMEAPFGRTTSFKAGGSSLYIATGDSDEISVFDQEGSLRRLIRRTGEPIPVTSEMVRQDRAIRLEEERGELEESHVEPRVLRMVDALPYPEFLPPYVRTILDSEMNLWVERFRVTEDDPPDWSLFDPEGVWLGSVTLPEGLTVYEIGSDYILGRVLDELEVEHVKVFEIIKP